MLGFHQPARGRLHQRIGGILGTRDQIGKACRELGGHPRERTMPAAGLSEIVPWSGLEAGTANSVAVICAPALLKMVIQSWVTAERDAMDQRHHQVAQVPSLLPRVICGVDKDE